MGALLPRLTELFVGALPRLPELFVVMVLRLPELFVVKVLRFTELLEIFEMTLADGEDARYLIGSGMPSFDNLSRIVSFFMIPALEKIPSLMAIRLS